MFLFFVSSSIYFGFQLFFWC